MLDLGELLLACVGISFLQQYLWQGRAALTTPDVLNNPAIVLQGLRRLRTEKIIREYLNITNKLLLPADNCRVTL